MPRETKSESASDVGQGARLLTVQEAARYLAVSVSTLYGWVWQRRIPFIKVGRGLRFDLADLEGFIEANRVRPGASGFSAR
jgi:excisionase family DNA binding protein